MKRTLVHTITPRLPRHLKHPLEPLMAEVLATVDSPHPREGYQRALTEFLTWHSEQGTPPLTQTLLHGYPDFLADTLRPVAMKQRLKVIRLLLHLAVAQEVLDSDLAPVIDDVLAAPLPSQKPKWLTPKQAQSLLDAPDTTTLEGRRDAAVLAIAIGCGLRRQDLVQLTFEQIEQRGEVWRLRNLPTKRKATAPPLVPTWAKERVTAWVEAAGFPPTGYVFRPLYKGEVLMGYFPPYRLHEIISTYAQATGLAPLHPRDLRHTFSHLVGQHGRGFRQLEQRITADIEQ
jgi:integrase